MGASTATWKEYLSKKLLGIMTPEEIYEESIRQMASYYRAGSIGLMPGARHAVEHCADLYKVGLASGSPHSLIDAALDGVNLRHLFEVVLSSDEVAMGKPAPDAYLEVIRRLGVVASECVVVEDSGNGILAGRACGARVIAVPNPHLMPNAQALRQADAVIDSLGVLNETLELMNQ
jgi:HAD superfamily hydrolase (TIGR01509 family)